MREGKITRTTGLQPTSRVPVAEIVDSLLKVRLKVTEKQLIYYLNIKRLLRSLAFYC